ncbi:MAG: protein kinase [Candidatus Berkiellales bacterium]
MIKGSGSHQEFLLTSEKAVLAWQAAMSGKKTFQYTRKKRKNNKFELIVVNDRVKRLDGSTESEPVVYAIDTSSRVGKGAQGEVFLAQKLFQEPVFNLREENLVILKRSPKEKLWNTDDDFNNEFEILKKLDRAQAYFEYNEQLHLISELCPGKSLLNIIYNRNFGAEEQDEKEQSGEKEQDKKEQIEEIEQVEEEQTREEEKDDEKKPVEEKAPAKKKEQWVKRDLPLLLIYKIARAILIALEELRKKGILHRDIKPENIKIEFKENGDVIAHLLDFGNSCFYQNATKDFMGTPGYQAFDMHLPPNKKIPYGYQHDCFSVGMIFWEMLAKKRSWRRFLRKKEEELAEKNKETAFTQYQLTTDDFYNAFAEILQEDNLLIQLCLRLTNEDIYQRLSFEDIQGWIKRFGREIKSLSETSTPAPKTSTLDPEASTPTSKTSTPTPKTSTPIPKTSTPAPEPSQATASQPARGHGRKRSMTRPETDIEALILQLRGFTLPEQKDPPKRIKHMSLVFSAPPPLAQIFALGESTPSTSPDRAEDPYKTLARVRSSETVLVHEHPPHRGEKRRPHSKSDKRPMPPTKKSVPPADSSQSSIPTLEIKQEVARAVSPPKSEHRNGEERPTSPRKSTDEKRPTMARSKSKRHTAEEDPISPRKGTDEKRPSHHTAEEEPASPRRSTAERSSSPTTGDKRAIFARSKSGRQTAEEEPTSPRILEPHKVDERSTSPGKEPHNGEREAPSLRKSNPPQPHQEGHVSHRKSQEKDLLSPTSSDLRASRAVLSRSKSGRSEDRSTSPERQDEQPVSPRRRASHHEQGRAALSRSTSGHHAEEQTTSPVKSKEEQPPSPTRKSSHHEQRRATLVRSTSGHHNGEKKDRQTHRGSQEEETDLLDTPKVFLSLPPFLPPLPSIPRALPSIPRPLPSIPSSQDEDSDSARSRPSPFKTSSQ